MHSAVALSRERDSASAAVKLRQLQNEVAREQVVAGGQGLLGKRRPERYIGSLRWQR